MIWAQLVLPIVSGVAVAGIVAVLRAATNRRKVPNALSHKVSRRHYLAAVLAMSQHVDVHRLDAFVPHLQPAGGNPVLRDIQAAWQRVNAEHGVRLVTRESRECLTAAAELLSRGIDIRVANALNTDELSYHVFTGVVHHTVLNHRDGTRDRPNRLDGMSPAKVFQTHFEQVWDQSLPLESVLADEVLRGVRRRGDRAELAEQLRYLRSKYALDAVAVNAVVRHLAFRDAAPVVFVTGLPGAGKSLVRKRLTAKLTELRFQVDELSDYVYAFHDFVHNVLLLDDERGHGFTADAGGAFRVASEENLRPALDALAQRVWRNISTSSITLVEFARSDVVKALNVFGESVLSSCHLIHVQASTEVRTNRLGARAQPPRVHITEPDITITVSDDHRLPSVVANSLYLADDFGRLRAHDSVAGRVHAIDNELDDPTCAKVDGELDGFIEDIVRPYRALAA
ncbi:hypothetical protein [Actinosynnema sp. NPDC023587]|uniref:hypothetical protein n=1 Tax=Actinosynnema sp. NPDC023587 TaxID=3154695 RepID=UPI00340DC345